MSVIPVAPHVPPKEVRSFDEEMRDRRANIIARRNKCERCDDCGGKETYANQACLPINGKVQCIDWCIHHIVAALNAGGVETLASCCGHGKQDGRIELADGRTLIIKENHRATEEEG